MQWHPEPFLIPLFSKLRGKRKKGFGEAIVRDYVSGKIGKDTDLLKNAKEIIARILEPFMGKKFPGKKEKSTWIPWF